MKNRHQNRSVRVQTSIAVAPAHAAIAARAESLWIERGRPQDQDEAIWLDAETQLIGDHSPTKGTLGHPMES